ncbi:MAG: hypothetical protein SVM86_03185, partial [Candidatus Cloacimonadota bacterium]|nr:hypothetical protein [Candidatus Cloacimonadota bacterium]
MQISDLIPIGKLGISLDKKDGFLTFRSKESISLDKLKDIFLVFSDHRVRYVTIDKIAESSKNQFSILETEVLEEIENVKKVQVMLDPEVWENIRNISTNNFKGYDVYYKNKIIGKIVDTLYNPAQLVL